MVWTREASYTQSTKEKAISQGEMSCKYRSHFSPIHVQSTDGLKRTPTCKVWESLESDTSADVSNKPGGLQKCLSCL